MLTIRCDTPHWRAYNPQPIATPMLDLIAQLYSCTLLDTGTPTDDGCGEVWSAVQFGQLIVADSLPLLVQALGENLQLARAA